MNLPEGYTLLNRGPATLAVRQSCAQSLLRQGIDDPERLIRTAGRSAQQLQGRGTVPSVPIEGRPGQRMIIRKYLRGGLVRFFNRDLYLGHMRPFRELAVAAEAASRGIPTADILAAVSIRAAGPLYRSYLVSQQLQACLDLPSYLQERHRIAGPSFRREKSDLIARTAAAVRSMHARGVYHGDLNLKNMLIDTEDRTTVFIIDWDKSRIKRSLSPEEQSANVVRLCRSMAKLARRGVPVTVQDQLLFLDCYWKDAVAVDRDFRRLQKALLRRRGYRR